MRNYPFIIKLLLLIYISFISISEGKEIGLLVIYVLLIIITTILMFITKNKYRHMAIILDIVISILWMAMDVPMAAYALCFSIMYILIWKFQNTITGVAAIPIVLIAVNGKVSNLEFILLMTIIYLILELYKYNVTRNYNLEKTNDEQRRDILTLGERLRQEEEYRRQSVESLKLEERNKLSQSMHDKIGHTLAGTIMQLEAAKIVLDDDKEKGKTMIDSTIKVLRQGMDEIRLILRQTKPSTEELGINKINMILEEKTKNTSFTYSLFYDGDIDIIDSMQWVGIIEGIREASTNSLKYSKGDKIWVNIEVLNKYIKVEIKDNGVGKINIRKGLGLISIEERIGDLKGKVIIDGSKGFSIIFLIPLDRGGIYND